MKLFNLLTDEGADAGGGAAGAEKAAADKAAADAAAAATPEAKAAADKLAADKAAADAAAARPASADDQRKFLVGKGGKAEELAKLDGAGLKKAYEDAKAADAKAAQPPADGKYEFKAPDGVTFDAEVLTGLETFSKNKKLSQGEAQELADLGVKLIAKQTAAFEAAFAKVHTDWIEATKSDKEFGGEKLDENLAIAKLGMQGESPEFVKMLNETGLGNHPEMVRHFLRIGKTRKQDTIEKGRAAANQTSGALKYDKSNHV